ncbi:MAG: hypothetical protein LUE92_17810 [Clostridiales bacterium]|nr:hypothetical protein [Clostridiales bacterium]
MNSKNSDSAVTIENLESAIDRYRREDVLRMLKKGVLDGLADEEQEYFYCRLASLRSMEILDYLSHRKACFPAKMMQLDFDMSQNRSFVLEALEKYHKKFNLSDDEECSQLFAIACAVGDAKMVKNLIRKKKAADCYPLVGSAPFPVFIQVSQIAADALSNDQWIELYLGAFISRDGYARMDYMLKQGLDLFRKNEEGKTAADLLEERTTSYRYSNKKNGCYQKIQEEQLLSELRKLQATLEQPPEEKHSRKKMIAIACACLAAAFVI